MRPVPLVFALLFAPLLAGAEIEYTVTPSVADGSLHVEMRVPDPGGMAVLRIPHWRPGSYNLRNYHESIAEVRASGPNGEMPVEYDGALTWTVGSYGAPSMTVTYTVKAGGGENGVHLSGPGTYLYVLGRKEEAASVTFRLPVGWDIAIGLEPDPHRDDTFVAPTYDVLADNPAQLGVMQRRTYKVGGIPHDVVVYGEPTDDAFLDRLADDCRRITEAAVTIFGDIPYKRYVFQFNVRRGRGGGGLEHLSSTEITISDDPNGRWHSLIAHEFFHLWNVKRLRPFALGPFDYTGPCRTNLLWLMEGCTTHYARQIVRMAGFLDEDQYLAGIEGAINSLHRQEGRKTLTVEQASRQVWDRPPQTVSYYTKGDLVGLCLDLKLLDVTDGAKGFTDVMRYLYLLSGRGNGPGFGEEAARSACVMFGGPEMGPFYDLCARSTEELPYEEVFRAVGVRVEFDGERYSLSWEPEATDRRFRLRKLWMPDVVVKE